MTSRNRSRTAADGKLLRAVAALLVLLPAGCVRFNRFYNAKRDFAEAERLTAQRGRGARAVGAEVRKYEACITRCQEIVTEHPESGFVDDCLLMIGKSWLNQGDYAKAERWLTQLVDNHPSSPNGEDASFLLGRVSRRAGSPEVAAFRLRRFLAEYPRSPMRGEAVLELILSLTEAGHTDTALLVGREALAGGGLDRATDQIRFEVGRLLLDAGDWQGADEMFAAVSQGDDRALRFEGSIWRGEALEKAGDLARAASLYRRLEGEARADTQIARVSLALAGVLHEQGEEAAALEKLAEVVELFPSTPQASEAHYAMARIYVEEFGDFEQAEEHFSQASRGKRWGAASRDALESLKELQQLRHTLSETGSAGLWLRAAECYLFTLDVPESALVCYRNAAGMDDSLFSPRASLALARLFERIGDDKNAREVLQELVQRYPSSQQAAQAREALSDTAQHVVQGGQGDPVRYQEAERALLGGDYETALMVFRSLANEATDEQWAAKAQFAQAWLLQEKLGRTDEAKRTYELVAERFPSSSYAREASRRLGTAPGDTVASEELTSAGPREPLVARCDTTEFGALQPVIVRVRVRPTGRAGEVVLVEGSGSLTCDETALDVARRARYQPVRSGEEATEGWWEGQVEVLGLSVERPPDVAVVEPEESALDTLPSFSTYVPPTYPPGLLVLAEGEEVVVALSLDEEGAISSTKIERAPEAVRPLVLQTVGLWRFRPAYTRGEAVACKVNVRFVVEGKEP